MERVGGELGKEAVFFPFPYHLPYLCFVTYVPSPPRGAYTPIAVCVIGVLPPEELSLAAASAPAPGAECAPGTRAGSEAACCGQQAIPHQQGPPCTPALPLGPLHSSLSLPIPGLSPLGTSMGVHQA